MKTWPKEWDASPKEINNGWQNNPKVLSEITTAINDEIYIEDENEFMEKVDIILQYMKAKYKISPLNP